LVGKHEHIVPQVLARLAHHEINSIIIEGGRTTLQHFIECGLWDEARVLTGVKPIDGFVRAPQIKGALWESFDFGPDRVEIFGKE
jgi:diaminohydroxyphosphoribosylaminopyrimidine deaminase/5-amino-6-(5-phosphoribosylamino)uracil reductase